MRTTIVAKGYKARDKVSHRKTSLAKLVKRFNSGTVTYRGKGKLRGSGHKAGQDWGEKKAIDPTSRVKRYSKNSPSFDEGVWQYKAKKASEAKNKLAYKIK